MKQAALMTNDNAPNQTSATVSDIPETRYDLRVQQSLRRIMHAVDIHSRRLNMQHDITASQLMTLLAIAREKRITPARIAREVHLTPSTLVGIIDRLEGKGLITRMRDAGDRRMVFLSLTEKGQAFVEKAPSPLHTRLAEALARLPVSEQATIAASLERVVNMMEKHGIEEPTADGMATEPPVL